MVGTLGRSRSQSYFAERRARRWRDEGGKVFEEAGAARGVQRVRARVEQRDTRSSIVTSP